MAFKRYQLVSREYYKTKFNQPDLDFEWDIETGELRGPDAQAVGRRAAQADGDVWGVHIVSGVSFIINRPLFSLEDMAILLGFHWELSDDLNAVYPWSGVRLPR